MADGKIRRMADTLKVLVPGAGIEPAQPLGPRDFKSLASTNSATQAFGVSIYYSG